MLTVDTLSAGYGTTSVIQDISFTLKKNSTLCILGKSGCGKSTLLSVIAGLHPPTQGQVLLDSTDITHTLSHSSYEQYI